jgi:hypothetical protein
MEAFQHKLSIIIIVSFRQIGDKLIYFGNRNAQSKFQSGRTRGRRKEKNTPIANMTHSMLSINNRILISV